MLTNEEGFRAIARIYESESTFFTNQKSVRWSTYKLAINASARESHYSDRRFFCNTFFKTFVLRNEAEIFANSQCLHSMFLTLQTSLLSEDTWSLKTLLDVVLSIEQDDRRSKWDLKFLGKQLIDDQVKNCSPSVSTRLFASKQTPSPSEKVKLLFSPGPTCNNKIIFLTLNSTCCCVTVLLNAASVCKVF